MDTNAVLDIAMQGLWVAAKLAAPVLITALAVGFGISLIQSITQIQEVTLSFVPKAGAVCIVLLVSGHWMISEMVSRERADSTAAAYSTPTAAHRGLVNGFQPRHPAGHQRTDKETSDAAIAGALDFVRLLRKTPIVVNVSRGSSPAVSSRRSSTRGSQCSRRASTP